MSSAQSNPSGLPPLPWHDLGRSFLLAASDSVVVVDAQVKDQPVIFVNPGFEQMTGYKAEEILGRNCRMLQEADRDQPERTVLREAIRQGVPCKVVIRNYRKDGRLFWNELNIVPVQNANGIITHVLGVLRDVTDRVQLERRQLKSAVQDSLTQLPNRKLFLDRFGEALERGRDLQRPAAVLVVNLDHFRDVNEAYGHKVGDLVLTETGRRLLQYADVSDTVGRIGGDNFALLKSQAADMPTLRQLAANILTTLQESVVIEGQAVDCKASLGAVLVAPGHEDADMCLRRAEAALKKAKYAGRGCFELDELHAGDRDLFSLRTAFRQALTREQLSLRFQPQLDLQTRRICGLEVLLRWQIPAHGFVSPDIFIPLAEETGMIVPVGEWVLENACEQHRLWVEQGLLDCPVAVNVSGVQVQRPNFVEMVQGVLGRTGLPASRLELELTESVMMDRVEGTLEKLEGLRHLGIHFSIDDFGTGFSSLGYLKQLPVSKLKIDKCFIRDIIHDSGSAGIALSVISMAHHLRMEVLAEGVETEAQQSFLHSHGCDMIQGYLIGKPMTAAEFEQFVHSWNTPISSEATASTLGAR